MKLMIIQPMNGRSEEDILKERDAIKKKLEKYHIEIADTYFEDYPEDDREHVDLYYLAKSIDAMSHVDGVYLVPGYEKARGCCIEEKIAKDYGLLIFKDSSEYILIHPTKYIDSDHIWPYPSKTSSPLPPNSYYPSIT